MHPPKASSLRSPASRLQESDGNASRFAVVVNLFDDNLYQADLIAERHRFPDWIESGHRGLDILLGKQVVTDLLDVALTGRRLEAGGRSESS